MNLIMLLHDPRSMFPAMQWICRFVYCLVAHICIVICIQYALDRAISCSHYLPFINGLDFCCQFVVYICEVLNTTNDLIRWKMLLYLNKLLDAILLILANWEWPRIMRIPPSRVVARTACSFFWFKRKVWKFSKLNTLTITSTKSASENVESVKWLKRAGRDKSTKRTLTRTDSFFGFSRSFKVNRM